MSTVGDAHGARSAEVIEVIRTVATRGDGDTTIFREVTSYWTKDGTLLAEVDPVSNGAGCNGVVALMRSLSINPTIPEGIRSLMKSALSD